MCNIYFGTDMPTKRNTVDWSSDKRHLQKVHDETKDIMLLFVVAKKYFINHRHCKFKFKKVGGNHVEKLFEVTEHCSNLGKDQPWILLVLLM